MDHSWCECTICCLIWHTSTARIPPSGPSSHTCNLPWVVFWIDKHTFIRCELCLIGLRSRMPIISMINLLSHWQLLPVIWGNFSQLCGLWMPGRTSGGSCAECVGLHRVLEYTRMDIVWNSCQYHHSKCNLIRTWIHAIWRIGTIRLTILLISLEDRILLASTRQFIYMFQYCQPLPPNHTACRDCVVAWIV